MSHLQTIQTIGADPERLESAYQEALAAGETGAFTEAIDFSYAEQPENLLYAAWHYRLQQAVATAKGRVIAWGWAIPLAVLNGLIFWWLSDDQQFMIQMRNFSGQHAYDFIPTIFLLWASISAVFVMLFLALAGKKRWPRVVAITAGLAALAAYVLLLYPQTGTRPFQEQYLTLTAFHLPLMAWTGVGLYLLWRQRDAENRFAFLIRSLEIIITGGLFAIAGGIFTGITFGLFQALSIEPPELVMRLFFAGGAGLLPVLAVAIIYDPAVAPARQSFEEGLSKLIAMLMRVLLPLSLLVLIVYLGFIPFKFREPFENRDVLIIYNVMLFAVMALLVGATPVRADDVTGRAQAWLRRAIIAVTALALLVGLYAFAAILYRTAIDKLTPNRLTFIGWNLVNIGILLLVLAKQLRGKGDSWLSRLHSAFAAGAVAYAIWALVVILAIPWLFGIDQGELSLLPEPVQKIVYDTSPPVLLKCGQSPHVYLLENGEKHWIKDIPTFEEQGYQWRDVKRVSCANLDAVPNGPPIPPDAGEPPEP
jgi:hypothetical protein